MGSDRTIEELSPELKQQVPDATLTCSSPFLDKAVANPLRLRPSTSVWRRRGARDQQQPASSPRIIKPRRMLNSRIDEYAKRRLALTLFPIAERHHEAHRYLATGASAVTGPCIVVTSTLAPTWPWFCVPHKPLFVVMSSLRRHCKTAFCGRIHRSREIPLSLGIVFEIALTARPESTITHTSTLVVLFT